MRVKQTLLSSYYDLVLTLQFLVLGYLLVLCWKLNLGSYDGTHKKKSLPLSYIPNPFHNTFLGGGA